MSASSNTEILPITVDADASTLSDGLRIKKKRADALYAEFYARADHLRERYGSARCRLHLVEVIRDIARTYEEITYLSIMLNQVYAETKESDQ